MVASESSRRVVALLPMKAHSERVKGKNFRDFCGKPLYAWVLDQLLSVAEIDQVVINTDAREILAQHGLRESERVVIRDRRPELCGDFVSMNRILEDSVLEQHGRHRRREQETHPGGASIIGGRRGHLSADGSGADST